jgi:hypothetical protein
MEREKEQSIEARLRAILAEIDYDFDQFTLEGFARWLEERRGRKIIFFPYHFERPDVSGAWVADEVHEYVVYETRDAPPVLQVHAQTHEMAHMLCGHSTVQIDAEDLMLLLSRIGEDDVACQSLFLRSAQPDQADEEELEAEMLASLIQEQVLNHSREQELLKVVSSDVDIVAYLEGLKMNWPVGGSDADVGS